MPVSDVCYELAGPLPVVVRRREGDCVALLPGLALVGSGATEAEALAGLEARGITTFERLSAQVDDVLGPLPLRQKRELASLVRRR